MIKVTNIIADALADLMAHIANLQPEGDIRQDLQELRQAVGLEEIESTTKNRAGAEAVTS